MKRLFKPIGLLVCMGAIVSSCSKKVDAVIEDPKVVNPVSDFTITPDAADGFTYTFKNLSTKYTKLEWRFGDDSLTAVESPVHTYLTTGDPSTTPKYNYLVDLKTVSSTGNISHKYANLTINPDDICKILWTKDASVANKINFSVQVKANAKVVDWTFTDADSPDPSVAGGAIKKGAVVKTTGATASRVYSPGTFNTVSVKVTTDKGSTVTVSRNVTSEGIAENVTGNRLDWIPSQNNQTNANENHTKLVDGSVETKFLVGGSFTTNFAYPLRCTFIFITPQKVRLYGIGSANDSPARDPKSWTVEGSTDGGKTWELMDSRTMTANFQAQNATLGYPSANLGQYKKMFYYPIAEPKEYAQIRLNILSNWGDSLLQFSEFQLFR